MQVGSIVEYIGGQDARARKIYPLEKGIPYVVNWMGKCRFSTGVQPAIGLEETGKHGFIIPMFKELLPPENVNIDEIIQEPVESQKLLIMNPEIKSKWIEALRSGNYKQGVNALRSKDDRYCCLGVLCDLYLKQKGGWWSPDSVYTIHGEGGALPSAVITWAGLTNKNPLLQPNTKLTAIGANDRERRSFAEIADLIEQNL